MRYPLAVLAVAIPLALASCSPEPTSTSLPHDVPVTLTNHTTSDVTILAPGETTPCDSCRITPAQLYRTVHLQLRNSEPVEFIAIFAGSVVNTVRCKWTGQSAVSVDWNNGALSCLVWPKDT